MEFLISSTLRIQTVVLFIGAVLSCQCIAQEDFGIRLKTIRPTLSATPNICELKEESNQCITTLGLIWESPKAGHFCLHNTQAGILLKCWENTYSGAYQYEFNSQTDTQYVLTRGINGPIVASAQVKVVGAIEQQLRARRRSGFWRIF